MGCSCCKRGVKSEQTDSDGKTKNLLTHDDSMMSNIRQDEEKNDKSNLEMQEIKVENSKKEVEDYRGRSLTGAFEESKVEMAVRDDLETVVDEEEDEGDGQDEVVDVEEEVIGDPEGGIEEEVKEEETNGVEEETNEVEEEEQNKDEVVEEDTVVEDPPADKDGQEEVPVEAVPAEEQNPIEDTMEETELLSPELVEDEPTQKPTVEYKSLLTDMDSPLDLSSYTKTDLRDPKMAEELIPTIEDMYKTFKEKLTESTEGYSKITTDGKNGDLDLEILVKTVKTEDKHNKYKIKTEIDRFLYICHDKATQMRVNTNLTFYQLIAEHRTAVNSLEMVIQFYHTMTKKVMLIDPRETLFAKFLIRDPKTGSIFSINKSILLKENEEDEKEVEEFKNGKKMKLVNIQFSGYKYTPRDDEFVNVEVYNSTDLRIKTGLFMLKGFIKKGTVDFVKKNSEELDRVLQEDDGFFDNVTLF